MNVVELKQTQKPLIVTNFKQTSLVKAATDDNKCFPIVFQYFEDLRVDIHRQ